MLLLLRLSCSFQVAAAYSAGGSRQGSLTGSGSIFVHFAAALACCATNLPSLLCACCPSPPQAAAWELAGPEEQRQLALASLPCANAVCTALAGSHGAALPARRCAGCRTARFCSALCQVEAWAAGHKAACAGLAATAAAVPAAAPAGAAAPSSKGPHLCPICGTELAAAAGAGGGDVTRHVSACRERRALRRCAPRTAETPPQLPQRCQRRRGTGRVAASGRSTSKG